MSKMPDAKTQHRDYAVGLHRSGLRRGQLGGWFWPSRIDAVHAGWAFLTHEQRPAVTLEDMRQLEMAAMGRDGFVLTYDFDRVLRDHDRDIDKHDTVLLQVHDTSWSDSRMFDITVMSRGYNLWAAHNLGRAQVRWSSRIAYDTIREGVCLQVLPHVVVATRIAWAYDVIGKLRDLYVPEGIVARWLGPNVRSIDGGEIVQPAGKTELADKWVSWIARRIDMGEVMEACSILKAAYPMAQVARNTVAEMFKTDDNRRPQACVSAVFAHQRKAVEGLAARLGVIQR